MANTSPTTDAPAPAAPNAGSDQTSGNANVVARFPAIARNLTWTHPKIGLKRPVLWWLKQSPIPPELRSAIEALIEAWNQRGQEE